MDNLAIEYHNRSHNVHLNNAREVCEVLVKDLFEIVDPFLLFWEYNGGKQYFGLDIREQIKYFSVPADCSGCFVEIVNMSISPPQKRPRLTSSDKFGNCVLDEKSMKLINTKKSAIFINYHPNQRHGILLNDSSEVSLSFLQKLFDVDVEFELINENGEILIEPSMKPNTSHEKYFSIPGNCTEWYLQVRKGTNFHLVPEEESLKKWCFYIETEYGCSSIVVIHSYVFATFRYGRHKNYKIDDVIIARHVDRPEIEISTKVAYIDDMRNYMLLRSTQQIIEKPPLHQYSIMNDHFSCGVFTKDLQSMYYGVAKRDIRGYETNGLLRYRNCDGAGCFTNFGLIGMFVRADPELRTKDSNGSSDPIILAADILTNAIPKILPSHQLDWASFLPDYKASQRLIVHYT